MLEAIIFDFDGVLFDSERLHFEANNLVLEPYGIHIDYSKYLKDYASLSDKSMLPLIFEHYQKTLTPDMMQELTEAKITAYVAALYAHPELDSTNGIEAFLKKMSATVKQFAICSNSSRQEVNAVLPKLQQGRILPYINVITTIDDVNEGKPAPEGYLLTAERLGVNSENCLVIEDSPVGIKAAKSANMQVTALTTTHRAPVLQQADKIVPDFAALV